MGFMDGPRCGAPKARTGEPCRRPAGEDGGYCEVHHPDSTSPMKVRGNTGDVPLYKPFMMGHTLTLKHGARTARVYQPLAAEIADATLTERPDLEPFVETVASWAEVEARCVLLRAHLARIGTLDEDDEPREKVLQWLRLFERQARELRKDLGLDPMAQAKLARERAEAAHSSFDLDAVIQRGQAALESDRSPEVEVIRTNRGD